MKRLNFHDTHSFFIVSNLNVGGLVIDTLHYKFLFVLLNRNVIKDPIAQLLKTFETFFTGDVRFGVVKNFKFLIVSDTRD